MCPHCQSNLLDGQHKILGSIFGFNIIECPTLIPNWKVYYRGEWVE